MAAPMPPAPLETWAHIADIVQAVVVSFGTAITAYVAVTTINAWRVQNLGKRKVELAESVLLSFYELRGALQFIRRRLEPSPGVADPLAPFAAFTMQQSEYYNRYQVALGLDAITSSLAGQKPVFRVYFGPEAGQPFDTIISVTQELQRDLRELFINVPADPNMVLKDKTVLLNRIGWGDGARPDLMDGAIEKAISEMDALCKPVLQGRR